MLQFFASDERIKAVRKMIMAVTTEQRKAALNLLLPYQRSDFEGIFRAMDGTNIYSYTYIFYYTCLDFIFLSTLTFNLINIRPPSNNPVIGSSTS